MESPLCHANENREENTSRYHDDIRREFISMPKYVQAKEDRRVTYKCTKHESCGFGCLEKMAVKKIWEKITHQNKSKVRE